MTHPEVPPPDPQRGGQNQPGQSEQVRTNPLSARVPDRVSRGVFSTGVIVMTGNTEFILDFLQTLGKPRQVAARVVMPHATLPQFVDALRQNLEMYKQRFGTPHEPPRPPAEERRPTVQEIYDELKLADDVLSGSYANGVMISHGPSEFSFDFLTNFFPNSAVSARVYMSASQAPKVLESLQATFAQFQQRVREQQQQQRNPGQQPPPPQQS